MVPPSRPPAAGTADAFDQSHSGRMRSAAVEAIYRSAFGEDYPAPAQPNAFYSATTLQLVIDALQLRPGCRFAFTTWEQLTDPAPGDDPQRQALAATFRGHPLLQSARTDYRQLTEQAGLSVETYQEPPGWRRQQQALAEGIIAAESEVATDMGRHYPAMARVFLTNLPNVRYILAVARRLADTIW